MSAPRIANLQLAKLSLLQPFELEGGISSKMQSEKTLEVDHASERDVDIQPRVLLDEKHANFEHIHFHLLVGHN